MEHDVEIDWGDDGDIHAVDFNKMDVGEITVESSGLAGGIAENENAYTVLDSPAQREQFLDELFEVSRVERFEFSS